MSDPTFRRWLERQRHRRDSTGELARLDTEHDLVPWFTPDAEIIIRRMITVAGVDEATAADTALAAWAEYVSATDPTTQPPPAA